jgi:hypothetical protein
MEVLVYRQSDFNKILRQLRNAGGEANTAYQKIAAIRQSIELDAPAPGRVTSSGETRIRHAVKYRLTDSYRLITLETGGFCIFSSLESMLKPKHGSIDIADSKWSSIAVVIASNSLRRSAIPI